MKGAHSNHEATESRYEILVIFSDPVYKIILLSDALISSSSSVHSEGAEQGLIIPPTFVASHYATPGLFVQPLGVVIERHEFAAPLEERVNQMTHSIQHLGQKVDVDLRCLPSFQGIN